MTAIKDAIVKDHRELEGYYNEIIHSMDRDHQERFGNQFTWELARHSVGEELVVCPAYEEYMGDKGALGHFPEHIKEEESRDMPAFEESLANAEEESQAFVPSRSHPSAGENPPFETVMGLLIAAFDHVADIFRKFPDKTISPTPSTK
ncbi:unnamed protein product [Clonostachys chloroleuca]|uniref:Hemerythrin-like domain-containing protein n=1 Tax=Clonostachys chloroleuca TaxID=1926264 RepID=A0AA35LTU1_9HYPO|nr:unnamed protein product [Clonostachys chloroleuca]